MTQPTPGNTGAEGAADSQGSSGGQQQGQPTPGTTGDNQPTPGSTGDKDSFTKDDVERIVQARLSAEKKKYGDYDDLKTKATEFDKIQQAQMSELEKANQKAASEEKLRLEREADLRTERTRNAVMAVASELKFVNPGVAHKLIDTSNLEYDDEGRPKSESVKQQLEALAKSDPYLVGQIKPRGDAGGGPRGGAGEGEVSINDRIRALAAKGRVGA